MVMTVDIGGTQLRISMFEDGIQKKTMRFKTPNFLQGYSVNEANIEIIKIINKEINKLKNINKIGICFPGPVSSDGIVWGSSVIYGKVLEAPYNFRNELIQKTRIENITVMNDLSAAALYFSNIYSKYIVITISSGIGGKIVINNELQISNMGIEGEIGHIQTYLCPEISISCSCGTGINHIGSIASGRGIADVAEILKDTVLFESYNISKIKGIDINTEYIIKLADDNDIFAKKVIDYCTKPLAYEISTLLSVMYLDKVILIGGVVSNSSYYFKSLLKNLQKIGAYNYSNKLLEERLIVEKNDDYGLLGMYKFITNCNNNTLGNNKLNKE